MDILGAIKMKNKYSIYYVNCLCGSYNAAYLSRKVNNGHFPKCKSCKRSLGDMDLDFLGEIVAHGDLDAMQRFNKKENK